MKTILLVEDDKLLQTAIKNKLSKEGFSIICADNGRDGLIALSKNPDIIITDIMLPYNSGYEVINAGFKKKIPVIVLSSINEENFLTDIFNLGASDYVSKPFSFKYLIIRINKNLK
jgi:DNA-binding response OmpR family regulator